MFETLRVFGSGVVKASAELHLKRRIADKFGEWKGGIFLGGGCSQVRPEGLI